MGFLKRLFGAQSPQAPHLTDAAFSSFLRGWEYELRSSSISGEELWNEAPERFFEHFPTDFEPKISEALLAELFVWTEKCLLELRNEEQGWATPTDNDRLRATFEALRSKELIALEDAGVSLQDGWARIGSDQKRVHRGAVFFHQQDVFDALRGEGLLLAFGAFEERPSAPSNEAIGKELFEALVAHGLSPSWSGDARERICLTSFVWQKRRWTQAPEVVVAPAAEFRASAYEPERLSTPVALRQENAAIFAQRVTAVRSSAGFNVDLSARFEALWKQHGGLRGQLCHLGLPHHFVPAGEQTDLGVRNAFLNLDPFEASSLRRRTRRIVIQNERTAAIRATSWKRSTWSPGGGAGKVGLFVLSASPLSRLEPDDSPVDWSEWCPVTEVPEGLAWAYRERSTDASRFNGLENAARLAQQHTSTGPPEWVVERIQRAQYGAFVQGEVSDPPDLGYVQVGWAIARWLLQRGDGVVMDSESGLWWPSEELFSWESGGWLTGRRFLLQREVRFQTSIEATTCLMRTAGLTKFGRPELLCSIQAEDVRPDGALINATIPGWVSETIERFATQLAMGAHVRPGDVLSHGSMSFDVEQARPGVNTPEGSSGVGAELLIRRRY